MELNDYQKKAMATCMPSSENILYMMMNLIGEVGEACEKLEQIYPDGMFKDMVELGNKCSKLAKSIRKGEGNLDAAANEYDAKIREHITPELESALFKELGDIGWQWSGLNHVLGWTNDNVAWHNILKLADRKKRNVIDGDGDNR